MRTLILDVYSKNSTMAFTKIAAASREIFGLNR
jgi:hypothetical protein